MFFETICAEGLNHYSYIIGDQGRAAVIDPRRDCRIYTDIAMQNGARIIYIFETHHHEDFVSGAFELSRRTQAKIYSGHSSLSKQGETTRDDQTFELGDIRLRILETPGHTPESISIAVSDKKICLEPFALFTGDTLLAGDVGRTDLYSQNIEELSQKLYDSLHKKILPLGDHVIIYPAHGHGAICAKNIADRKISTIGYERICNPILRKNRSAFVREKISENNNYTPHFMKMQKTNQQGIQLVSKLAGPAPESIETFAAAIARNNMNILDVRSPEAYAAAHIPASLSIPIKNLPFLAGWFLPHDMKIGLVTERENDAAAASLLLMRMGYDNISFYIAGGMAEWIDSGHKFSTTSIISTSALKEKYITEEDYFFIDVGGRENSTNTPAHFKRYIWIGDLQKHLANLPVDKNIITFCSSGRHATTAASLLEQANFNNLQICRGKFSHN